MKENKIPVDSYIIDFLQGTITQGGKRELEAWIHESSENKDYFRHMYTIWKGAQINTYKDDDIEKAFQLVMFKTDGPHNAEPNTLLYATKPLTTRIIYKYGKWAAVILFSLFTGASLQYIMGKSAIKEPDNYHEISVPLGSISNIHLPDGTEVVLNAGSSLSYKNSYGDKDRMVTLIGEGYFKVARNSHKTFMVHTSDANIKALGTEFNVKAYPEDDAIVTILVKGSVEVNKVTSLKNKRKAKEENTILLKPGEKVRVYKEFSEKEPSPAPYISESSHEKTTLGNNRLKPETTNYKIETSWKDSQWIVNGLELKDLAVLLARRYNVQITINDAELLNCKFSGTIQNETVEQVFNIMRLTIPMSYTIDKGQITVSLNPSLQRNYSKAYNKQPHS